MAGGQTPALPEQDLGRAKLRLETICNILSIDQGPAGARAGDPKLRQQQQEALATVFEEIVFGQGNKFDSQSLRLLMDFQWQNVSDKTSKLQEELSEMKQRFE